MTKEEIITVVQFATKQTELSYNMLQIEFKMGFHWAYKMMDILEKNGFVEPFKGNPTRKVLNNNTYENIIVINLKDVEP
jgi:DNA segregation ATPase FtsK/SpoIIIE-like protein